jgi:hypothetical protein
VWEGTYIIIVFLTLSIVLFLFETYNVLKTEFYLRFQVEPTQLGATNRASPYLHTPAPIQDNINQAEHKPSARVKTNIKNIKRGLAPMSMHYFTAIVVTIRVLSE